MKLYVVTLLFAINLFGVGYAQNNMEYGGYLDMQITEILNHASISAHKDKITMTIPPNNPKVIVYSFEDRGVDYWYNYEFVIDRETKLCVIQIYTQPFDESWNMQNDLKNEGWTENRNDELGLGNIYKKGRTQLVFFKQPDNTYMINALRLKK